MNNINIIAGLDIGNGYVKGSASNANGTKHTSIDFISGVAYETNPADLKVTGDAVASTVVNIFNEMEASFDTPLVKDSIHRLFGTRGVSSGNSIEEFDVNSALSKANQPLSAILTLGCIAGKALQVYYEENGKLPEDTIPVTVGLGLALPISEYKSYRKQYAANLKGYKHLVCIHNFEHPVRFEITVTDVQVLAEGASAQYAISAKGEPLMNAMLADARSKGEQLEGITAADVLNAKNTIGIDIGEGTVNFPVFQNGKFNPDASVTLTKGYGTVLEKSVERLNALSFMFGNRKSLSEFIQTKPNALNRSRHDTANAIIAEEIHGFAQELCQSFIKVLGRAGAYAEVIYVYGGGATPVKDVLYEMLIETAKGLSGGIGYPVLYLDSRYSRYLNREGLYLIAEKVATSSSAPTQATKTLGHPQGSTPA